MSEKIFSATRIVQGEEPTPGSKADHLSAYYERPYGFYSENLRSKMINSSARVAGVGGGGLTLAVLLAHEGVRDISIADLDRVDDSNIGRIPLLTPKHVGKWKVDVAAEMIAEHNPTANIRIYGDGIQKHNVEEFVGYDAGNNGETVAFDEIELTEPQHALLLHRTARKFGRYVISATDVGRGGMVTTFSPHTEQTYEHYMGALPSDSEEKYLKKVRGFQLPTIPGVPTNGSLGTFISVMKGESLPTTMRSVLVATNLALDEFEKVITIDDPRYKNPHIYPDVHINNPDLGEDFVTRRPRRRTLARIGSAMVGFVIGKNPPADYRPSDIERRQAYRNNL